MTTTKFFLTQKNKERKKRKKGRCDLEFDLPPLLEVVPSQKDPSFLPPRRLGGPCMTDILAILVRASDRGRQRKRQPKQSKK